MKYRIPKENCGLEQVGFSEHVMDSIVTDFVNLVWQAEKLCTTFSTVSLIGKILD